MSNIKHYVVTPGLLVKIDESCDMSLVYMFDMPRPGDTYVAEVCGGESTMLKRFDGWCFDVQDTIEWAQKEPHDGVFVVLEVGYFIGGTQCMPNGLDGNQLSSVLEEIWGLDDSDPDALEALHEYIQRAYRFDYVDLNWHMIVGMVTEDGGWSSEHVAIFDSTVAKYVRQ